MKEVTDRNPVGSDDAEWLDNYEEFLLLHDEVYTFLMKKIYEKEMKNYWYFKLVLGVILQTF